MNDQKTFAWCFSHGALHCFAGEPWCTARWVSLPGGTEEEAMSSKKLAYGEARFLHQLPHDWQIALLSPEST